ncbi:MAG: DedA family protein [Candidatus Paceibacterota bacterium]|jgi:membrane-associated protein
MEATLHSLALWLESSKYILLIIGTIIEGPVVMMVSGFLFGLGQFSLVPMYFALVFGDFIADIGWYCLGRFGTRRTIFKYGHFLGLTPKLLEMMEERFHKYHQKILIISKLTMGMGFAFVVLIVAGTFKVPFKNYVFLNLVGGFIWTALLVTVGYFVGNIFLIIPNSLKVIFVAFVFIAIIIGLRYATKYLKKQNI